MPRHFSPRFPVPYHCFNFWRQYLNIRHGVSAESFFLSLLQPVCGVVPEAGDVNKSLLSLCQRQRRNSSDLHTFYMELTFLRSQLLLCFVIFIKVGTFAQNFAEAAPKIQRQFRTLLLEGVEGSIWCARNTVS